MRAREVQDCCRKVRGLELSGLLVAYVVNLSWKPLSNLAKISWEGKWVPRAGLWDWVIELLRTVESWYWPWVGPMQGFAVSPELFSWNHGPVGRSGVRSLHFVCDEGNLVISRSSCVQWSFATACLCKLRVLDWSRQNCWRSEFADLNQNKADYTFQSQNLQTHGEFTTGLTELQRE